MFKKGITKHTGTQGSSLNRRVTDAKTVVIQTQQPGFNIKDVDNCYIVCLLGPNELVGRYWELINPEEIKENVFIGRGRDCDISIPDISISKKHLSFRLQRENKVFITDHQSTNGTIINGKRISSDIEYELADNSKIKIGAIVFKFLNRGNPEIISIKDNFHKMFHDPLTEVGNKLLLEKKAVEYFQSSLMYKEPLSLILFDIDHFKKVNDTYGHLAGDFVLREVVNIVKLCVRMDDVFARCGGEEFCIIMQSPLERAVEAMEIARKKVQNYSFEYENHIIRITVSAGVSHLKKTDNKWLKLYERADQLLYKSKNAGRNQTSAS